MHQPVIGIPAGRMRRNWDFDNEVDGCGHLYAQAVLDAGGLPWVMPLTTDPAALDAMLSRCDGLLLTGGGDVNPQRYRPNLTDAERRLAVGICDERDEMEIHLCRAAWQRKLPVLAICRGLQVLNVALGGTLHLHIDGHEQPRNRWNAHRLVWRDRERWVNSSHHQALDKVAPELTVTARADDGIVEAAECRDGRYCVGVQFHPERLVAQRPEEWRWLFREFVDATTRR
ncbi:MAG: type 1 glutamine amidotransferase [Verrucomicrobiae bacterium]|nr:type 1 glutamine amidotransferase [Verrucomicrobiae bacterium]MDW8344212.1 type 1 glutamine amidotransferase [Verrucomicrobiae bacterium]